MEVESVVTSKEGVEVALQFGAGDVAEDTKMVTTMPMNFQESAAQ